MTTDIPSSIQAWRLPVDETLWVDHHSLQLRDVEISPPGEGEVLVKLHATSLNYRVGDILIAKKLYGLASYSSGPDGQGHILTSDGAGEVVAVGPGVAEWVQGDRVVTSFSEQWLSGDFKHEYIHAALGGGASGCLVQYRVFPANILIRIPSYLTYEEAATLPCAGVTAWACLFETVAKPIGPDSTILVQGSGGTSVFGAQLAKVAGARVIATTSSNEKAETYKSIVGVDEVLNYREAPEWSEEARKLTNGKGVEHILEVGGQTTFSQSLKAAQIGGHVHIIGTVGGFEGTGINFGEFSFGVMINRLHLHGQSVGSTEMFQRMVEFMERHKVKPVIGKVFEWDQAVEALDYAAAGAHFGKVVIKIP